MKRRIRFLTEWRMWQKGQETDTVDYGVADALVGRRIAEWVGEVTERKPRRFIRKRVPTRIA
jgi:hypothetical protein